MSIFTSLMRRADTLRRVESDPVREAWWTGYMRGLRRAHHGQAFGTDAEHELWLAAAESDDSGRAALGLGYLAGLSLEIKSPPGPAPDEVMALVPEHLREIADRTGDR